MTNIQAIETEYKGHRFRSRLEARWAVFFDAAEIEWQYEIEGFRRWAGAGMEAGKDDFYVSYLPDFYLPRSKTWVEVKGSDDQLGRDVNKLEFMLSHGSSIPGVDDSYTDTSCRGLLILGEIFESRRAGIYGAPSFELVLHPLIQQDVDGLYMRRAYFVPGRPFAAPISPNVLNDLMGVSAPTELLEASDWTTRPLRIGTSRGWSGISDAYKAAQQARFEHGQIGAPAAWRR